MGKKKASLRDKQVCLLTGGIADIRSLSVLLSTNERSRKDNHFCFDVLVTVCILIMYTPFRSHTRPTIACLPLESDYL